MPHQISKEVWTQVVQFNKFRVYDRSKRRYVTLFSPETICWLIALCDFDLSAWTPTAYASSARTKPISIGTERGFCSGL
jgi:hypothetical protein